MQKKSKTMDKILDFVPFIILIIVVLAIAGMVSKKNAMNDKIKIKEISYSEYEEKIAEDVFSVIIIGRDNCSHCNDYKPLVNKVANDYNLDVYYLNISKISYEEYINIHDSVTVLKYKYDEDNSPVIPTPTTVIYKKGLEISSELGNIGSDGFLNMLVRNGVVTK